MNDKKSLRKHLLALYLLFFAVVVISITGKIIPDMRRGAEAADRINTIFADSLANDNIRFYLLSGVEIEPYHSKISEDVVISNPSDNITVSTYADRANLVVKQHFAEEQELDRTGLSLIGNNPIFYIASVIVSLGYIAMLVLIALIISSLRRSAKNDKPVDHSNTIKVRVIGSIIILGEIITSLVQWGMNCEAAELLKGAYSVNTLFSPNYLIIIIGILVLFMGELFSITHSLGEEQKLTI